MSNQEFKHIEISELLFKSSDSFAIELIKTLTNNLFFTNFSNFKIFILIQYEFNEFFLQSITKNDDLIKFHSFIKTVKSHNKLLLSDIIKFKIENKIIIPQNYKISKNELAGWLYVYFFCDYFSSFYFKEINKNINYCSTKEYLLIDSFNKKRTWNLFNNFLNKNYFNEINKKEILRSIDTFSTEYINILGEKS